MLTICLAEITSRDRRSAGHTAQPIVATPAPVRRTHTPSRKIAGNARALLTSDEGKVSIEIHNQDEWLPTQFHLIAVFEGNLARVLYSQAWPGRQLVFHRRKNSPPGRRRRRNTS